MNVRLIKGDYWEMYGYSVSTWPSIGVFRGKNRLSTIWTASVLVNPDKNDWVDIQTFYTLKDAREFFNNDWVSNLPKHLKQYFVPCKWKPFIICPCCGKRYKPSLKGRHGNGTVYYPRQHDNAEGKTCPGNVAEVNVSSKNFVEIPYKTDF